jgi:hypothetical protein
MSVGQVESGSPPKAGAGGVKVGAKERPGGRTSPAEPALSFAELRQWLSDLRDAPRVLPARERQQLMCSIELLRRGVERFNQGVPEGLRVELNPELVGLLVEAHLCQS